MVVTPVRLAPAMRRELDRLVPVTGAADRSALVRRLLADGIRRANATRGRLVLSPQADEHGAPPDPAAP